jgi:hypothetical protein
VTALSQVIERFPYLRMAFAKLVYSFRQLLRHAGIPPTKVDAMSLGESLPVSDLCAENVLNELAGLLDFWHGQ